MKHTWAGRISRGHPRVGRGPSDPHSWRFPPIYAYTLCCGITIFDVVTNIGRGLF